MKSFIQSILILISFNTIVHSQTAKILFVLSTANELALNDGEKLRQTGVFLNEFYLAYSSIYEAGYQVEIATIKGEVASIDQESLEDKYWEDQLDVKQKAEKFILEDDGFNNPLVLSDIVSDLSDYTGLIIPGGQGLMIDLISDKNIPILLNYFAKENKPTGLICHAPSLLLTLPKVDHPYKGYKVNSVSPSEEFVIECFIMKGKPTNRKISRELRKMGMNYKRKLPKANYAVKDRNLVTSQNPFSTGRFNELYLEALLEYLN